MRIEDMVLVSVDDHVVEPPDMFDGHVPDRFADQAPLVVLDDNGAASWVFGNSRANPVGLNAVASWPKEDWGFDPVGFAEMRPGCYDVGERLLDMDANGVHASLNFPTMAHFSGRFFMNAGDLDLAHVMVRAYNDWILDEWCGADPERLIPLVIGPLWDPELMAAEVRRSAAKGARALSFTEAPHQLGLPSLHSGEWDPLFEALCDEGVVLALHIGSGGSMPTTSPDAPIDVMITLPTQLSLQVASDLVWGPVLRQFPELRVALSEGGSGWVPSFLERIDRSYRNQTWTGQDFGDLLPSDVFREHVLTCFITDRSGIKLRDDIGIENLAWECDFPHSDSTWPRSPELLMAEFVDADVSDDDIDAITHRNARRFFGLGALGAGVREQVNVGALRARSADVDTGTTSRAEYRARHAAAAGG